MDEQGAKKNIIIFTLFLFFQNSFFCFILFYVYLYKIVFLAKLKVKNLELFGDLAIWKFIGSLLGLYSFEDLFVSLKSDKWLLEAAILDNAQNNLDELSRHLNSYLGANDFLRF